MASLTKTGEESGTERWEAADRSVVEYRAPDGQTLRFNTFQRSRWLVANQIGAEITSTGGKFELWAIDSIYYTHSEAQVFAFSQDNDHDANDSHMDEYESHPIVFGTMPSRVEALCRAQWHGARFRRVVVRGPEVFVVGERPQLPDGFPESWPRPGGLSVRPYELRFEVRRPTGSSTKSIVVRNLESAAQTIQISAASTPEFDVHSSEIRLASGGEGTVSVTYRAHGFATRQGSFELRSSSGRQVVRLLGYTKSDNR